MVPASSIRNFSAIPIRSKDMSSYGLSQIYEGENAEVDIVFLHGLRGHREDTWKKNDVLWPRDLLPVELPASRIFLFGYDSRIYKSDLNELTKSEIGSDAEDLTSKLAAERLRTQTENRPIVFIAHSLGGLVAAQALVHGEQKPPLSNSKLISQNLRGLIFLGTPFRGSSTAKLGEIARRILSVFGVDTQQKTLKLLGVDSDRLNELTRSFSEVLNSRRISNKPDDRISAFFFYETQNTWNTQIVENESAQLPGCGDSAPIRANHIQMCKFGSKEDEGFSTIVAAIRKALLPFDKERDLYRVNKTINVLGKAVNVANESMNFYAPQTNNF